MSLDQQELDALICQHKDRIFIAVHALIKDRHLSEDLAQDVIIKIICKVNAGQYNDEGKFLPWALNNMVELAKKNII